VQVEKRKNQVGTKWRNYPEESEEGGGVITLFSLFVSRSKGE